MSFVIHRLFSNSESGNLSTVQNPRLIVRSATAATPLAVVNVAQGLIVADTRTETRRRKSDKCNPPPDFKLKCARYAVDVSCPTGALKKFEKEYPRYCFSRPTISRWTKILKDSISSGSDITEICSL